MSADYIETKDSKGNSYKKWRINKIGNSVVCTNGTNTHYKGQPNISIRTGPSIYGKEIVMQLEVNETVSSYQSSSGFNKHIEIYFTEEQAVELLSPLFKQLGGSIEKGTFNPKEWARDSCEVCEGPTYCNTCKKYTWHKMTNDEKESKNNNKEG